MILKCFSVSFIVQNFKEVFRADLEFLRIRSFKKSNNFHVPLFYFVKKPLQHAQSCEDAQFFLPKWSNSSKWIFFGKNIHIIFNYTSFTLQSL